MVINCPHCGTTFGKSHSVMGGDFDLDELEIPESTWMPVLCTFCTELFIIESGMKVRKAMTADWVQMFIAHDAVITKIVQWWMVLMEETMKGATKQ